MTGWAIALVMIKRMAVQVFSSSKCFCTPGKHTREFFCCHHMWTAWGCDWIPGKPGLRRRLVLRIHLASTQVIRGEYASWIAISWNRWRSLCVVQGLCWWLLVARAPDFCSMIWSCAISYRRLTLIIISRVGGTHVIFLPLFPLYVSSLSTLNHRQNYLDLFLPTTHLNPYAKLVTHLCSKV